MTLAERLKLSLKSGSNLKEFRRFMKCQLISFTVTLVGISYMFMLWACTLFSSDKFIDRIDFIDDKQSLISTSIVGYSLTKVPDDVLSCLSDWQFSVVTEPIEKTANENNWSLSKALNGKSPAGITVYGPKLILVMDDVNNLFNTTAHEIAHAYDSYIGNITGMRMSKSDEFLNLYNTESGFVSEYDRSTSAEYFAETLGMFWTNPDKLRKNAPMTYEFYQSLASDSGW